MQCTVKSAPFIRLFSSLLRTNVKLPSIQLKPFEVDSRQAVITPGVAALLAWWHHSNKIKPDKEET